MRNWAVSNGAGEERDSLIAAMRRTGVPILTMCLSGHRKFPLGSEGEAAQARSLEIMDDAILLARDLGIRIIQIAGYDEYYNPSTPGTRENFLTNLRKAVTTAAREGVLLAFETMETDFINTVGKAAAYVKKIDSPYLQIYPDLGNITNAALTGGPHRALRSGVRPRAYRRHASEGDRARQVPGYPLRNGACEFRRGDKHRL